VAHGQCVYLAMGFAERSTMPVGAGAVSFSS